MAGKKARCTCGTIVRLEFDNLYGDLDAILDGVGDASPVMASRRSISSGANEGEARPHDTAATKTSAKTNTATIGFLAALGSATLGFWFGILILVVRFHEFNAIGLDQFSQSLQSAYLSAFGAADVPPIHATIFVTVGWVLWLMGFMLVVVSMVQIVNAFSELIFRKQFAGWADGVVATVGVVAVFLMVALVFTQTSFRRQLNNSLDDLERPAVVAGEHLPHVEQFRQEYNEMNRRFTITILVGAAIPMSIFVLSLIRLFVQSPDLKPRSALL